MRKIKGISLVVICILFLSVTAIQTTAAGNEIGTVSGVTIYGNSDLNIYGSDIYATSRTDAAGPIEYIYADSTLFVDKGDGTGDQQVGSEGSNSASNSDTSGWAVSGGQYPELTNYVYTALGYHVAKHQGETMNNVYTGTSCTGGVDCP